MASETSALLRSGGYGPYGAMPAQDTLVVFVRYPVPGRVKTRLGRTLGDDRAARVYDAFVRDLVGRFAGSPFQVRWAVAPPNPGFAERFCVAAEHCCEQEGADLGARMLHAFRTELAGQEGRCVLIGSDAPHLSVEHVHDALARLGEADVVLGPAMDGGYYLIAMGEPHDVFSGITWSVDSVREATRARARDLGLRVAELAPDFDVDDVADLERLRELLRAGRVRCPATERLLAEVAPS